MSDESTEPDPHEGRNTEPDTHPGADRGADPGADTGSGEHAAPDGAPLHPLIDLSRDPTPGKPDHARPDQGD